MAWPVALVLVTAMFNYRLGKPLADRLKVRNCQAMVAVRLDEAVVLERLNQAKLRRAGIEEEVEYRKARLHRLAEQEVALAESLQNATSVKTLADAYREFLHMDFHNEQVTFGAWLSGECEP